MRPDLRPGAAGLDAAGLATARDGAAAPSPADGREGAAPASTPPEAVRESSHPPASAAPLAPASLIEDPAGFDVEGLTLWDGAPSLGGVWAAHPGIRGPLRGRIRNLDGGAFVDGALLGREGWLAGPSILLSAEAARALGIEPGQVARVRLTALAPAPSGARAGAAGEEGAAAGGGDVAKARAQAPGVPPGAEARPGAEAHKAAGAPRAEAGRSALGASPAAQPSTAGAGTAGGDAAAAPALAGAAPAPPAPARQEAPAPATAAQAGAARPIEAGTGAGAAAPPRRSPAASPVPSPAQSPAPPPSSPPIASPEAASASPGAVLRADAPGGVAPRRVAPASGAETARGAPSSKAGAAAPQGAQADVPPDLAEAPERPYVQVASFRNPANAEAAARRFAAQGLPVRVGAPEGGWVRLLLGPFAREGAARDALDLARAAGFPDAMRVRR
ncbi:Sporulation related domain-containing protein [Oceanicella actignis]|uniref:Sporulation related domain-containing protein n=1 Tax=Oceanicella actignis TaxID=1189325 RepID=A0A1M7TI53_9RHOB|nr:Sporulation related domain-containing protein [Oceanicella actignis]SHN70407.1 Sporulation related domain-containing protein [Oceanicella actignis]